MTAQAIAKQVNIITHDTVGDVAKADGVPVKSIDKHDKRVNAVVVQGSDLQRILSQEQDEKQAFWDATLTKADVVFARTSGEHGSPVGITAFLVPTDAPGFSVDFFWWTFNMPTDHAHVRFRDVRVPSNAIFGGDGRGLQVVQQRQQLADGMDRRNLLGQHDTQPFLKLEHHIEHDQRIDLKVGQRGFRGDPCRVNVQAIVQKLPNDRQVIHSCL